MKFLSTLLLLVWFLCAPLVGAQKAPDWIKVAPADERFQAFFPQQPKVEEADTSYPTTYGMRTATGKVYSASLEGSSYTIWSFEMLRAPYYQADQMAVFLDEYADLVWESLLKPEKDALPQDRPELAAMVYRSEAKMGVIPWREYSLKLGDAVGATRFYMDGGRVYVLVGLGSDKDAAAVQRFLGSFLAKSLNETPFLPVAATIVADPIGRVFKPGETSVKAKVLSKPEPAYTDAGRKYRVTGTVVLTAAISTDGRVSSVRIVKRLPHGLTESAMGAAERIRFSPATKDGMVVNQSIQLEYVFNIY